jgi:hypothetical protein
VTRLRIRLVAAAAAAIAIALPAIGQAISAPTANPGYNWAARSMRDLVSHHGWSAADAGSLGRTATRRQLARGLAELMIARGERPPTRLVLPPDISSTDPDARAISWVSTIRLLGAPGAPFNAAGPFTGRTADIAAVRVLGLTPEVRALNTLHTANGLRIAVPPAFGQVVLANELGLHHDYALRYENLETNVNEAMPVADLAGMVSAAIHVSSWQLGGITRFDTIVLPNMTAHQLTVVRNGLAEVGYPYVWGGTSPAPQALFGANVAGGFDCSGLVWWAFKVNPSAATQGLGSDIRGRTADAMAWETPSQRVPVAKLKPGDLVFFGPNGIHTPRGGISHAAISLGNGWIVQSVGGRGVTVTYVPTWWPSGIAWGRRLSTMAGGAIVGGSGGVTPPVTTPPVTTPPSQPTPPAQPPSATPGLVPGSGTPGAGAAPKP